ncbi:hypothetical protein SEA_KOKO_41 [Mycobacterium phage Koko]|uniref:Uncharacterized protein n=2 Tax=Gladiatorvirus TaxID=2948726 RepID=G8I683_9CAUD|nr:hypothetical protein CL99_gp073 [Mycobacterium phage Blue7]YP_010061363.1 hypothetical protein KIP56_gp073 [Mycobacterium phage Koko]AER48227.1 hypothetical protein BLUE7_42 [Mycobacterium phage Blue7]ATW60331.1 hypothetical protein SEA_KOKO_41 [Mycobacterium phage Koko]WRQ08660.1 hypothetical protein JDBV06_00145 [Mycobacterium phage miche]
MIDTDEQDHDFFDILYQQWSKTTLAEFGYWVVEEYNPWGTGNGYSGARWMVRAVEEGGKKLDVGLFENEANADFVAGIHGALPDLIRRLHEAIDEATRKDEENDRAQGMLAEALLENQGLKEQIRELEAQIG